MVVVIISAVIFGRICVLHYTLRRTAHAVSILQFVSVVICIRML